MKVSLCANAGGDERGACADLALFRPELRRPTDAIKHFRRVLPQSACMPDSTARSVAGTGAFPFDLMCRAGR